MPKIKHIGITTKDPGATADFLISAFGLVEIEREANNGSAILSDGYINVTILKFEYDRYGGGYPGLHHFGFQVEDLDESEEIIIREGGQELTEWNQTKGNREGTPDNWIGEKKFMTPEGISLDVNPSGWKTRPGGVRGE
jgi:catechol 2,3-dioxygenase-like lactoylglutathione lyase family enzyme